MAAFNCSKFIENRCSLPNRLGLSRNLNFQFDYLYSICHTCCPFIKLNLSWIVALSTLVNIQFSHSSRALGQILNIQVFSFFYSPWPNLQYFIINSWWDGLIIILKQNWYGEVIYASWFFWYSNPMQRKVWQKNKENKEATTSWRNFKCWCKHLQLPWNIITSYHLFLKKKLIWVPLAKNP